MNFRHFRFAPSSPFVSSYEFATHVFVQGAVSEFGIPKDENPSEVKFQFQWCYVNGLLGIIFTFGLLSTALKSRRARAWRYSTSRVRSFIADYGVPLMVVVWTAVSFSVPNGVPEGVPRRLYSPLPWQAESLYHWTVVKVVFHCVKRSEFSFAITRFSC